MKTKNTIRLMYVMDLVFLFILVIGSVKTVQKVGLNPSHHILFNEKKQHIYVHHIIDKALKAIFSKGDRLDAVNHVKIFSKDDLEFIFDRMNEGEKVTLSLNRDGKEINSVLIVPHYYTDVNIVLRLLVALIFFISGIYVSLKNPQSLIVKLWYLIALCASVIIACTWGKYNITPFDPGQISRLAFLVVYAFVPNILIHLSIVFPLPHKIAYKKYLWWLYLISMGYAVFICFMFLEAIHNNNLQIYHQFITAFNINRLYFAGAIIFTIFNFIHSYRKAEDEIDRRKILWLIFGISFGPMFYAVFHQIPQSFGFNSLVPLEVIVVAMLSIPTTFTIAIIKYNLFDIETIVQQSTLYVLVISILFLIYAGLVGLAFLFIGRLDIETALASAMIAAILIPFILEPFRNFIKNSIDKRFFRKRYNYRQAMSKITQKLGRCYDQKSITILLFNEIDNILNPESMGMYLPDTQSNSIQFENGVHFEKLSEESLNYLQNAASGNKTKVLCSAQCTETNPDYFYFNEEFRKKNPHIAVVPVIRNRVGGLYGLFILGMKKSKTRYNSEDVYLLTSVMAHVELEIERITLQQQLIRKSMEASQLKELDAAKSFFVSSVSHDLQTPLTSIKMFSELLREKKDLSTEKRNEFISVIENESERLSRLIKNVLDLSQIERGVKKYDFSAVDLNEIVKSVFQLMKYSLEQNGFKVKQKLVRRSLLIKADKDAIISGIVNLVSNAMKYSVDKKEIEIKTFQSNGNACIAVCDRGIGIPGDEQDKIFHTFYRSEDKQTQNVAGIGLGLTILSHMIRAHDGKILLESTLGKGSTFTLSFPKL